MNFKEFIKDYRVILLIVLVIGSIAAISALEFNKASILREDQLFRSTLRLRSILPP